MYLLQELLEHREKDEVVKLVSTKSHGTTPLVIACRNGHYDVAEYLIEKCGANVNQPGLGKNYSLSHFLRISLAFKLQLLNNHSKIENKLHRKPINLTRFNYNIST